MLEFLIEIRVLTKPELYLAGLLELNNNRECRLMTRECSGVISQLLTYRKCFQRVGQRSAREMCEREKV